VKCRLNFLSAAAARDGFVSRKAADIEFTSIDRPLASASFNDALAELSRRKRTLIVFFDQFEELFTKKELLPAFEVFRRIAIEVDSLQSNLIVGFSWRSGINLPDDHPAYFMWQDLRDKRFELKVAEFTPAESSAMITKLGKQLQLRVPNDLRRRLAEQTHGLPWLLKKLCIHIYTMVRSGRTMHDVLATQLNVKELFDEDLEPLTQPQIDCLRYVAARSPADIVEVAEVFGDIPDQLYTARLILRTGGKYALYWDIFRDYMLKGEVPSVPMTYIPQTQPNLVLTAFQAIQQETEIAIDELGDRFSLVQKSVFNLLGDLLALMLIQRRESTISVNSELCTASLSEVAEHLAGVFAHHSVLHEIRSLMHDSGKCEIEDVHKAIRAVHTQERLAEKTVDVYRHRLVPWFLFCGLLNLHVDGSLCFPPAGQSEKGQPFRTRRHGGGLFLGASPPERCVELIEILRKISRPDKAHVSALGLRNAATDLVALGLATWSTDGLELQTLMSSESTLEGLRDAARRSPLLQLTSSFIQKCPQQNALDLGRHIGTALGRQWAETSMVRNGNSARVWYRFITANDSV